MSSNHLARFRPRCPMLSTEPDQDRENRFFVEAPRKILAHLINQQPETDAARADVLDEQRG
jgi:hypothetical protein